MPSIHFCVLLFVAARAEQALAACSPGTRRSGGSCVACPEGTYSATNDAARCTDCATGTYADNFYSTSCKACPSGSYSNAAAASCLFSAETCPAGTHAESPASCTDCPAGKASADIGSQSAASCIPCSPGFIQIETGSSECTPCLAGTYQTGAGFTSCMSCPLGTSSPAGWSSKCVDCPAGHFANEVSSRSCEKCLAGTYQPLTKSTSCLECSAGSSTNGKRGRLTKDDCKPCEDDFVANKDGRGRCSPCVHSLGCETTSTCRDGYEGESCFRCQKGWFHSNDECLECTGRSRMFWVLAIVFFFMACTVFYLFSWSDSAMAAMAVSLNHLQLTGLYLVKFPLNYPPMTEWISTDFGKYLLFDLFEITRHDCHGKVWFTLRWVLAFSVPVVACVLVFIALKYSGEKPERKLRWGRCFALIASVEFLQCFLMIFKIWACRERSDGTFALEAEPGQTCDSADPEYGKLSTFAFLASSMMMVIVNYNLFFMVPKERHEEHARHARQTNKIATSNPLRAISMSYKQNSRNKYWFVIVMIHKLCAAALGLFLNETPRTQSVAMAITVALVLLLLLYRRPYVHRKNHRLDAINLCLQLVHLGIAWGAFTGRLNRGIADMVLVAVFALAIILNCIFCVWSLVTPEEDLEESDDEDEDDPQSIRHSIQAAAAAAEKAKIDDAKQRHRDSQIDWLDGEIDRKKKEREGIKNKELHDKRRLLRPSTSSVRDREEQAAAYQTALQRRYEEEEPKGSKF